MTKINVIVDHQKWHKKISNPEQYLKNKIKKLRNNKILKNNSEEFSLLLTNTNKMKKLKDVHRNISGDPQMQPIPAGLLDQRRMNQYCHPIRLD